MTWTPILESQRLHVIKRSVFTKFNCSPFGTHGVGLLSPTHRTKKRRKSRSFTSSPFSRDEGRTGEDTPVEFSISGLYRLPRFLDGPIHVSLKVRVALGYSSISIRHFTLIFFTKRVKRSSESWVRTVSLRTFSGPRKREDTLTVYYVTGTE